MPAPAFDAEEFISHTETRPGIYRMLNDKGEVIYVGKAGNLRNRLRSYFRGAHDGKTQAMVSHIASIEVVVTHSQIEALLLENQLIKRLRPRYNILMRDDKSYPYIHISTNEEFPRFSYYRGGRSARGRYIGPFPNGRAAKHSLYYLQKVFRLRLCDNHMFNNRTRPCIQYEIKRCSAPCVGFIDGDSYRRDARLAQLVLRGRDRSVQERLTKEMEAAAGERRYEDAAGCRDRLRELRAVTANQHVSRERGDFDVFACALSAGQCCVQLFMFRNGINLGNRAFFPKAPEGSGAGEILGRVIGQFYERHPPPAKIIIDGAVHEDELLANALSERAGRRVSLLMKPRGDYARIVKLVRDNAGSSLSRQLASRQTIGQQLEVLGQLLGLEEAPLRLECFDISHFGGEETVASCVVFTDGGAHRQDYRRFIIRDVKAGDDYAALESVLRRRYSRILNETGLAGLPDVVFVDGGAGQVGRAQALFADLGLSDIKLAGIVKGPGRDPAGDRLVFADQRADIPLHANPSALHLVQQLRDEAHRFAIAGHRGRRAKARKKSPLDSVPGVGAARRRQLMAHFGGIQGLAEATAEDMAAVAGISPALAEQVHAALHPDRADDGRG